jgi:ATP-dependent DNA ligase
MTAQHYSRRASRNWTPKKRCSTYIRCMLSERMRKRLATDRASFIEPCLPSPAAKLPSGSNWIHEIKHDGFRLIARRDPVGIRLITRKGNDWTTRYPLVAEAVNLTSLSSYRAIEISPWRLHLDRLSSASTFSASSSIVKKSAKS